jgi:hypothetical protein
VSAAKPPADLAAHMTQDEIDLATLLAVYDNVGVASGTPFNYAALKRLQDLGLVKCRVIITAAGLEYLKGKT